MTLDIEKAKQKLAEIAMKPKKDMGKKRAELEKAKDIILKSLKTASLRQVHTSLKQSGFTGSLSLFHATIKEWKDTYACPACGTPVKRFESKKAPGKFFWQCIKCKKMFYDKKGECSGAEIVQNSSTNSTQNSSVNSSMNVQKSVQANSESNVQQDVQ